MDRSTLSRILLAVGVFFLIYTFFGKGCGGDKPGKQLVDEPMKWMAMPAGEAVGAPCVVQTREYSATIAGAGGGITGYVLLDPRYTEGTGPTRRQIDLAYRTAFDSNKQPLSSFNLLRPQLRNDARDDQVTGEVIPFRTEKRGDACVLIHETPGLVRIERTFRPGVRAYELDVTSVVLNLASVEKQHVFSQGLAAYQFKKDEGGMLSRPGPNDVFQAGCSVGGKIDWKGKGDLTKGGWQIPPGTPDFAAIATAYIGQAIVPLDDGAHCALAGDEVTLKPPADTSQDGTLMRASIAYARRTLAPGQSASYHQILFAGPKERHIVAAAAGGARHLDNLIDLGRLAVIAKVLVAFLKFVHDRIGSWGIAIIILTIAVRAALFPLTLSQIRGGYVMRRLKPEIDAINKKFESEPQMKMVATSELYKKNGYSPFAGCLPAILQMPVWFALYTALQTAIELFHESFGPWADLSSPDPRFILPLILGATMFVQQKVTPMQMDPAQQKIFTYFMPAMFTVFMLFLPAGLGVYMLTNSVLGIAQTIGAERYYASKQAAAAISVKVVEPVGKLLDEKKSDDKKKKS